MDNSQPTRALGRYLLEQPIATGTTATIWRARDTKSGREVAVKRFHEHLRTDRRARQRMNDEARAAQRVRGPTIISAIDRISTSDEFALVFPFVPGVSLAARLREAPRLTPHQAATIAADVAQALAAIHGAGFVHRDVKPGNILLADDGRARLLDFGISRAVTDDLAVERSLTGAGMAIGTLPYMAPEQLTAQSSTAATDVFALGVVLYEMLATIRPYAASSPVSLATEQRLPPPRIALAPDPLVDLALRALAIDPSARPTAIRLSDALRRWLADPLASDAPTEQVTTVAAIPSDPPQPAGRRRGWLFPLAGVAGAVMIVAVVAAAMPPSQDPHSPAPSADGLVAQIATPSPHPSATPSPASSPPAAVPTTTAKNPVPASPPTTTLSPPAAQPSSSPVPKHAHHQHHPHGHHHHKKHHHHHGHRHGHR